MKLGYSEGLFSIILDKKLDYDTAEAAYDRIFEYIADTENSGSSIDRIIIDADKLAFISSAGIRILLELKKRVKDLRILNVSDSVYDVISITGLEDVLGIELKGEEKTGGPDIPSTAGSRTDRRHTLPSDFVPVTRMFEKQAELHPGHPAVVSSKGSYSYKELNESANKIANTLINMDAGPDDIVCILLERGIEIYAATIGALKAGCAYAVVNPRYPDERIEYIYKDSGAKFIISSLDTVYDRLELFVDRLQKRPLFFEHILSSMEIQNPDTVIYPGDLCYVKYTSGSTGKPKGVMLEHGNLSNFLIDAPDNPGFTELAGKSTRSLAMAQMTFDVSVMEEYIPLVTGHTSVFALFDEIANPAKLIKLMVDNHVDGAVFTPSYLSGMMKLNGVDKAIAGLKAVVFCAEPFLPALYTRIREYNPDVAILNSYGPTETTIICTTKILQSAENITIGFPHTNVEVTVIDEQGNELPKGETGELLIAGKCVGRGYINLPEKTAELFIGYKGMRAYKSGDLCRINSDNEIESFGRKDFQVKIRGLRIELGEVESVMNGMDGIDICVAAAIEGRYLCLYYTSEKGVAESEIRTYAKEHLAHYMLPDIYMKLDEMPMTENKKANRKALPIPQHEVKDEQLRGPETETQETLLKLLNSVIEDRAFGIDQNLPDGGLSSLDIMLFISLIGSEFNIAINIGDFVQHPTIMDLEQFISSAPKLKKTGKLDRYHATERQITGYNEAKAGGNELDLPTLYEMDKDVDTGRLREAVYKTMAVHPGLTLRLEPDEENELYQIPQDDFRDYDIRVSFIDDSGLDSRIHELCTPLPPDGKWLFKFEIIETPSKKYLFTDYNHLNSDGASISIIIEDIIAAYEGKEPEPEQLTALEYGEFLSGFWDTKAGKICTDMYMKIFDNVGGAVTFPPDKNEEKWRPAYLDSPLSVSGSELKEYCTKNRLTESTLLAGALGIVLAGHTKRESIAFSFGYSGRNDSRLSNSIGYIATALEAFCNPGKHTSCKEYLREIDRMLLNVQTFPIMPIMSIFEKYPNALDIVYLYQPYSPEEYEMDGHKIKVISLQERTVYESIKLIVQPVQKKSGDIIWKIDYHGNLYSEDSMNALVRDLNDTVRAMITDDTMK